jgi:hypothetical protein
MTSLLAMLFLVLFAVLALGFYAASTVSVQVARSDVEASESAVAADSGLNFMRYQMARLRVPAGTTPAQMLHEVYNQLASNMDGTANLGANAVGFDGTTVSVPSASSGEYVMIAADGGRFRATIASSGGRIVTKVTGRHRDESITRTVQMQFDPSSRNGLFDFAIASRGQIATGGSSHVYGSPVKTTATVLSADKTNKYPIVAGGKEIGGDLSIVSATADVDVQGGSVGGSSDSTDIATNHIHRGVPEPEFPTVDVSVFTQFVSKPYTDASVQSRAAPAPGAAWPAETLAAAALPLVERERAALPLDLGVWRATPRWDPGALGAGRRAGLGSMGFRFDVPLGGRSTPQLARSGRGFLLAANNGNGNSNGNGNGNGNSNGNGNGNSGGTTTGGTTTGGTTTGGTTTGGTTSGGSTSNGNGNGNGNSGGASTGGGGTTYTNCYVPANANPTFNAKDVIQGVLYIHAPNQVKFAGGCTIRGVVVVENSANCTPADTNLDFRGNVEVYGVETLDPTNFAQLKKLTGTFVAAENATVDFKGNFTTVVSGSIIAGGVSFGGSAGGSINGSIIGMNAAYPMTLSNASSSPIVFIGTARTNPPSGVNFTSYLKPDAMTYLEVDR